MQSSRGLSWSNGLSACWAPRSSVLHPDTSSGKHGVEPGQGISTPTKYPAPRQRLLLHSSLGRYPAPHSSADQGPGIPPKTRGQTQPWPCLAAGMQGKAGDGNAKEQRQSPEEEMRLARAVHGNLHKHPKNAAEAPAPTRRNGLEAGGWVVPSLCPRYGSPAPLEGGHSLLHPVAACNAVSHREPALLPVPGTPWSQGCHGCHVEGRLLAGTAKSERKELELV